MKIEIDLEEFAEQVKNGQSVTAQGGVLNDLLKQLTEMTLKAELDSHLAQDLEKYMDSYNRKRLHSAIDYKTPNQVYYDYINNLGFRGGKLLQSVS